MQPPKKPTPQAPAAPKGSPSNAKSLGQFTMDELKKTAASRGIPVEKLIAQMVQQYLQEDKKQS